LIFFVAFWIWQNSILCRCWQQVWCFICICRHWLRLIN
jgi:hypothetical protein